MSMSDLDHSSTGFYTRLIVLPVSSKPTLPGVRPLQHPAVLQGRQALRAGWPCRHCDRPAWTMGRPPGVQSAIVSLLIRKDRDETRTVVGADVPEQERDCSPSIKPRTGHGTASHKPRVSTNRGRLRPWICSPPLSPRSGPPISVVLTDWLSRHTALGVGARPAATRVRSRQAWTILGQVPSSRHWAK